MNDEPLFKEEKSLESVSKLESNLDRPLEEKMLTNNGLSAKKVLTNNNQNNKKYKIINHRFTLKKDK